MLPQGYVSPRQNLKFQIAGWTGSQAHWASPSCNRPRRQRAARTRWPNLKLVFLASRIYGGYAHTDKINPGPYAYEYGFSVKWLIQAQVNQMATGTVDRVAGDLNFNRVGVKFTRPLDYPTRPAMRSQIQRRSGPRRVSGRAV